MTSRKEREQEELLRRKKALRRFKTLARIVMYNLNWLLEVEEEEQKLSLNVKKNIAMLVRPHRKIGLLTLPEKILLRTNHFLRTVKDRKRLVSLFASLTCFSIFPPKIRARLVPVATFSQLQKGRYLIKEGSRPIMMSFILYGEVELYKRVYNHITEEYEDKLQGLLGAGDCVGELEFLEKFEKRRNTYICSMDTEVLVVLKEDFKTILKPVMSQQWLEKKIALNTIQYFDFFLEDQVVTACKLGSIRQFNPLDTIYYKDKGLASYVHFVVSGECMILQCLRTMTRVSNGKKTITLMPLSQDTNDAMFEDLTNKEIMKKLLDENKQDQMIYESQEVNGEDNENAYGIAVKSQKYVVTDIETLCTSKLKAKRPVEILSDHSVLQELSAETIRETEGFYPSGEFGESRDFMAESEDVAFMSGSVKQDDAKLEKSSQDRIVGGNEKEEGPHVENKSSKENQNENIAVRKSNESKETVTESGTKPSSKETSTDDSDFSRGRKERIPDVIETEVNHFIDVGAMTFGGIFGLGEKIEDRVIIARTTVQCLLLPRFWLLEKEQNPGNIWQRRRFYLDRTIPSRQTLFKNFLATLKWQKFKTGIISSILDPNSNKNATKVEDIPIICRLTEGD